MDTARKSGVWRVVLLAAGPAVGIVAGVLTNLISAHWSWWVFSALVVAATVLAAAAVLNTRPVEVSAEHSSLVQAGSRRANMLLAPAGTRIFCGRADEQDRLIDAADNRERGPHRLVITGIAGVGKTELAIRVAEELAPRYPDGVFWIGLRTYAVAAESRLDVAQGLRMLLNVLGEHPDPTATGTAALSTAWRAASAGQRILLILDDVGDPAQVETLLPGGADSAVMITSRHVLVGIDPDCYIHLQPFDRSNAEQLAEAVLDRAGLADRAAVSSIADRYRLPLALRHICNLRIGNPGIGISDLLMTSAAGPDEASAALALSLDALTRDARQLLRKISRYPGSRTTAAIAATLVDKSLDEGNKLLADLYQHGLLSPDSDRGYHMHDLVREAAFCEAVAQESRREVAATDDRIFRYITAAIGSAHEVLYPGPFYWRARPPSIAPPRHSDDHAALGWLDLHYADLLAVSRHAIAISYPRAWLVIYALEYYQRIRWFYPDSIELEEQALRIAEDQKDRLGQASTRHNLGIAYTRMGDYKLAHENLETALRIYENLSEFPGQAMVHNELAKLARVQGNLSSAREHAESALSLFTRLGHAADIGAAHRQMGILDRLEGHFGPARAHFQTAARLYESGSQRRGIASCHRELGLLDQEIGCGNDARTHFEAAVSLYQLLGDAAYEAETHQSIAVLDLDAGDMTAARQHLEAAMELNRRINNRHGQADVYVELGNMARMAGNDEAVRQFWSNAASIYAQLKLQAQVDEVRDQFRGYIKGLGEAASS
jgi:tetratricopeptide (TPR) repeat protein